MVRRSYFSFTFILLITLFAITVWLDKITYPTSNSSDLDFHHLPDYILENISGLRVEHDKSIHRSFHAKNLIHFTHQELTQLEDIQFINTETKHPLLRLFADQAELRDNGEDIYLNGNVTVIRGNDEDIRKITLKTDKLQLLPDESKAKTDTPVVITRHNTTIKGIGLELNNETGMLELLSRVQAVNQNP